MEKKKGFTLVELMVVIAIVAILAAVALPMYSTFKQKAKVGAVLQSLQSTKTALQGWYDEHYSFTDIDTVPSLKGAIKAGTVNIGAGLAEVGGNSYSLIGASGGLTADTASLTIGFAFSSGCPTSSCNGQWSIICNNKNDTCVISATVGAAPYILGMNITANAP